jgi:hypothetical protein
LLATVSERGSKRLPSAMGLPASWEA